jgi:autoinducer 2 (AI-2) kinase
MGRSQGGKKCLLALDAGIGGGRCIITDIDGNLLSSAYQEWSYVYPNVPGGVEFNADHFWSILCDQIKHAIRQAGIKSAMIKGVSATAQRETSIFFDEEKEILALPCTDTRVQSDIDQISDSYGKQMKAITGRFPSSQGSTLLRLWWLKQHRNSLFKRIRHILTMNDWILYRLSGKYSAEPSNATHTNAFNVHTREWSKELIDTFDLPDDVWPELHESGEPIGEATIKAEEETGLLRGTPIISGGADSQCGVLGTATTEGGQIAVIAGTTTPILLVINKPINQPGINLNCHLVPHQWVLESNAGSTGIILRHFKEEFAGGETTATGPKGLNAYQLLDIQAEKVPPGTSGLYTFLASRIPNNAFPTGSIIDQNPRRWPPIPRSKNEVWRALLENICYGVRANIENVERQAKTKAHELRICGGQANSGILMQMQADVIGKPVLIPRFKEATALGAIICAGVGSGYYSNLIDAAEALVQIESRLEPNETNYERYQRFFEKWKALSGQLAEILKYS